MDITTRCRTAGILSALVLVAIAPRIASAQRCTPDWSSAFPRSHYGTIYEFLAWTDGPGEDRLIAIGAFTSIEGLNVRGIAQFDGRRWAPLGSGFSGGTSFADDVTTFDGDGDGVSELYVVGEFTHAGGVPCAGVARWDGAQWGSVGGGLAPNPYGAPLCIEVFDAGDGPRLYAGGGELVTAIRSNITSLAMFNGVDWVVAGGGVTSIVRRMHAGTHPVSGEPLLYMVGDSTSSAPGFAFDGLATWDGRDFQSLTPGSTVGSPYSLTQFAHAETNDLYVGGDLAVIDGVEVEGLARWDGTQWHSAGSFSKFAYVQSLYAFDDFSGSGPALYVSGAFTSVDGVPARLFAKWNGMQWSAVGDPATHSSLFARSMQAFEVAGRRQLWVASDPIQTLDAGEQWTIRNFGIEREIDSPNGEDLVVRTLQRFDDGTGHDERLFVGGAFELAGPLIANSTAAWDGERWWPMAEGINGLVTSSALFDDGTGESLHIGCSVSASPVMYWEGDKWNGLPCPFTWTEALAVLPTPAGQRLIAATNSSSGRRIMQWDGSTWSQMGGIFNGSITCLAVVHHVAAPVLYTGGWFTNAGGAPLNGVARWDGTNWQPMGAGLPMPPGDRVMSMVQYPVNGANHLVIGGSFSSIDGVAARNIAQWDGSSWSALDAGTGPGVLALSVVDEGDPGGEVLYAAGGFHTVNGSLPAECIARWNGTFWQVLQEPGATVNGSDTVVRALATFAHGGESRLYLGGTFDTAGGRSAARFDSWRGCPVGPPAYPVCRYEVLFLDDDRTHAEALLAYDLDSQMRTVTAHTTGSIPDSLFRWSEQGGLQQVTLPPGTSRPLPTALNDTGTFGAYLTTGGQVSKAAINIADQWTIIPALASEGYSSVTAINNSNVAVGVRAYTTYVASDDEGYIWSGGTLIPLTHPGADVVRPRDINSQGDIVGNLDFKGDETPFIRVDRVITELPILPDSIWPYANAVNDHRQVVGGCRVGGIGGNSTSVLWHNGTITDLGSLSGYRHSYAYDINSHGDVVGRAIDYDLPNSVEDRAVLWRHGEIIDLNLQIPADLYLFLSAAYAINDAGEILCEAGMPVILRPIARSIADLNGDCAVDINDLMIVIYEWGEGPSLADITGDGAVNIDDLLQLIAEWR